MIYFYFFFFFQAEDGIRDPLVTGVQTCALPIWLSAGRSTSSGSFPGRSFVNSDAIAIAESVSTQPERSKPLTRALPELFPQPGPRPFIPRFHSVFPRSPTMRRGRLTPASSADPLV